MNTYLYDQDELHDEGVSMKEKIENNTEISTYILKQVLVICMISLL